MKVLVGVVVVVLGAVVFCFLVLIGTNTLPNRPITLIALERCVYQLSCRLTPFLAFPDPVSPFPGIKIITHQTDDIHVGEIIVKQTRAQYQKREKLRIERR